MRPAVLIHLPGFMMKIKGPLPTCWVTERKHKCIKKFSNNLTNVNYSWDQSVLREVTLHHLNALQMDHFGFEVGLLDPVPCSSRLTASLQHAFGTHDAFHQAIHARLNRWDRISAGDAVFAEMGGEFCCGLAQRILRLDADDGPMEFIALQAWTRKPLASNRWSTWCTQNSAMRFCSLSDVRCSVVWSGKAGGAGEAIVLDPHPA